MKLYALNTEITFYNCWIHSGFTNIARCQVNQGAISLSKFAYTSGSVVIWALSKILAGSLTMQLELYNEGVLEFSLASTTTVTVNSYDAALSLPTEGVLSSNYGYYFNYMQKITKKYTAAAVTSPMQFVFSVTTAVAADTSVTLTMLEDVFTPTVTGASHLFCYFRKVVDSYFK